MEESALFVAELDDAHIVLSVLNSVLATGKAADKQRCVMRINREGIRTTVEHNKLVQATVFLSKNHFKSFTVNGGEVEVWLDLQYFLKCLGRFGNDKDEDKDNTSFFCASVLPEADENLSLTLKIQDESSSIEIIATEAEGVTTKCLCSTLTPCEFVSFPDMTEGSVLAKISMTSSLFADLMLETPIQEKNTECLGLHFNEKEAVIWTHTITGRQEISLEEKMEEVHRYNFFGDSKESFLYRSSMFRQCLRPLSLKECTQTTITVARNGLLQIQFNVDGDGVGSPVIIEYLTQSRHCEGDPYEIEHPVELDFLADQNAQLEPRFEREVPAVREEISVRMDQSYVMRDRRNRFT